jgi:hypothetical protein
MRYGIPISAEAANRKESRVVAGIFAIFAALA